MPNSLIHASRIPSLTRTPRAGFFHSIWNLTSFSQSTSRSSSKSKRHTVLARMICISRYARLIPRHACGPRPNGLLVSFKSVHPESSSYRSGMNSSGSGPVTRVACGTVEGCADCGTGRYIVAIDGRARRDARRHEGGRRKDAEPLFDDGAKVWQASRAVSTDSWNGLRSRASPVWGDSATNSILQPRGKWLLFRSGQRSKFGLLTKAPLR